MSFGLLCFTEIIIFKVAMICAWKHYSIIDESFTFRVTILFNYGFIIVVHLSRLCLGSLGTFGFEVLTGSFLQTIFERRLFWATFISIDVTIMLIGIFLIVFKKSKRNEVIPLQNINFGLNQVSHNIPMLNYYEIGLLITTSCILMSLYGFQYTYSIESNHTEFSSHLNFLVLEVLGK